MKINHSPIFETKKVEELYSEKDGVPVRYVCTSSANMGTVSYDIFFRDTPHPEFGNRYFGLFRQGANQVMITNADTIENLDFAMIEGPNGWEYSQDRWDYRSVGNSTIDGGRAYFRLGGDLSVPFKMMKLVDGDFVEIKTVEVEDEA